MDIGVGLDPTLGLNLDLQRTASKKAAELGYQSIWTPENTGQDSYQICLMRWAASKEVVPEGLQTGIAVSPVMWRTPMAFAMAGGTVSEITSGKFTMGIGAGGVYRPDVRKIIGSGKISALEMMKDYLIIIRGLLNGEKVSYEGTVARLTSGSLGISPAPKTPVYLGALGPKMLQLAGQYADGAALNWCAPEQIAWSREQIANGANKSNRNPNDIKISEYIRVCVDDDEDKARIALAKATMFYALGSKVPTESERRFGYRAHFERMGFTSELAKLDQMRSNGASRTDVADAFPVDLLRAVGYFGKAEGAAKEVARLSQGLDNSIVRVVSSTPGTLEGTLNVIDACSPEKIRINL